MFIDTIDKIDNFIISKINFQDNEIELKEKYYLIINDVESIEGDSEHYDYLGINFEQFLSQPDINFIIQKYETLLISEIEYYQQDFITIVANNFRDCNTELSQKMYYENTILSLKNCISRFTEKLAGEDDFNIPLNNIQIITINIINDAHSGIIGMLNNAFGKYISPEIDIESRKTIFGLEEVFVERLYNELVVYELFNIPISKELFFRILNVNYEGDTKICLKLKNLPEFYYLIKFLAEKYSGKSMTFYKQISGRFLITTNVKSNISFNAKKIANGISDLTQSVVSRVIKNSSEIIKIVNNLK